MVRIDLRPASGRSVRNKSIWYVCTRTIYDDLDTVPPDREVDYQVIDVGTYKGTLPQWKRDILRRLSIHLQANNLRGLYARIGSDNYF